MGPEQGLEGKVRNRTPAAGMAEDVRYSAEDTVQSASPCCSGKVS